MGSSSSDESYNQGAIAPQGPLAPAQRAVLPTSVLPANPSQMATGLTPQQVAKMQQEQDDQQLAVQGKFGLTDGLTTEPTQPRDLLAAAVTVAAADPALARRLLGGGGSHEPGYTTSASYGRSPGMGVVGGRDYSGAVGGGVGGGFKGAQGIL